MKMFFGSSAVTLHCPLSSSCCTCLAMLSSHLLVQATLAERFNSEQVSEDGRYIR